MFNLNLVRFSRCCSLVCWPDRGDDKCLVSADIAALLLLLMLEW